jgi:hypothetical protein
MSTATNPAADVLHRLATGLHGRLPPPAQYGDSGGSLTLAPEPGATGKYEVHLAGPGTLVRDSAGTGVFLSFASAGIPLEVFSLLDDNGNARLQGPRDGAVTGLRFVPPVDGFFALPPLEPHVPSAATGNADQRRQRRVLISAPAQLTLTAYETRDGYLRIAVEGEGEPAPDMALRLTTTTAGGQEEDWALHLRWSLVRMAVSASLTIGRSGEGLNWKVAPEPVPLTALPHDVLTRSQAGAAEESSVARIAQILAGQR